MSSINNCKIPFNDILNCTTFLFKNTYFVFNNEYYQQLDGTPMGSPISSLFADIVMDDLESDCLHNLKNKHNCIPLFYYRYVDDTILCIHKDNLNLIIDTFNSYNNNIQFTFETQDNEKINFLDVTLKINNSQKIICNWYQKPISSGRLINYYSGHPVQQKVNIVYNLVDRAILLSHSSFHNTNLAKLKQILLNNDYPLDFIKKHVKIRLNSIKFRNNNNKNSVNPYSHLYKLIPKICIPFNYSDFAGLSNILKPYNIKTIPIVNKNLKSIVKLGKDKTEKWSETNVVYKFNCKNCSVCYVGETKRMLKTRIDEHKRSNNSNTSVVSAHHSRPGHEFDWDNTTILDREPNYKKRCFSEMLHIKSNKHTINKKTDILYLNKSYFPIIRKLKS